MRDTRIVMGMPITIEIADQAASRAALDAAFDFFQHVDEKFSTYKSTSEISAINRSEIAPEEYSSEMQEIFRLCDETTQQTNGYFDITRPDGLKDPSGLVKGWSIYRAADILKQRGCTKYFIDAGGDIEARGKTWSVGIKNPFKQEEIVKAVYIEDRGIATSGTYIRGNHIYNPHTHESANAIASLSVIGPNVYEADRFATAAFAMGKAGIMFIEKLSGLEGYMIDLQGIATMTTGFNEYTHQP